MMYLYRSLQSRMRPWENGNGWRSRAKCRENGRSIYSSMPRVPAPRLTFAGPLPNLGLGITLIRSLIRTDRAELIDVMHTNLLGTIMACRSVLKIMTRNKSSFPVQNTTALTFSTRKHH